MRIVRHCGLSVIVMGLAVSACGCREGRLDQPSVRAGDVDPRRPVIASEWYRIIEDPAHHLNDFCLFEDQQGVWHCIGIMGTGTWRSEQSLFHWTGQTLRSRFAEREPLLSEQPDGEVALQKHAPFVVWHEGLYHLFYRRPMGTILHMRSPDPNRWEGLGEVVFQERDARDVCIRKIGGVFYMYYCQSRLVEDVERSCIMLRRSRDLREWDEPVVVHVDLNERATHSYLESPTVVVRDEGYYLFIRHRLRDENTGTVVLFSQRPDLFPSGRRAWFAELANVHAPEIVQHEGRYYLARVSGAPHTGFEEPSGWVELAELKFE